MAHIPAGGYPGALCRASRQPHTKVVHRARYRVDSANRQRAVVLAGKAKQGVLGAPDRAEGVDRGPQTTRLSVIHLRRLQVGHEQPPGPPRGPNPAADADQDTPTPIRAWR